MNEKYQTAFQWIINILLKKKFRFQISGGLAARVYGSKRDLYDIDIDLEKENINKLSNLKLIQKHIILGPKRVIAANFDVYLLTLKYNDILIDLGCSMKMYCKKSKQWIDDETKFEIFELKNIYGLEVPVIPKKELIKYKKVLSRKEDLEDLKYIT